MRKVLAIVMFVGAGALLLDGASAAQKEKKDKEVTLKGKICCAKCELMKADKCMTVIVVTKEKKETIYYFDSESDSKHHESICAEAKKGVVTAVVSGDAKKKVISVKSLKFE
jgi:hypothetical protein